jgi:dTDP-4-dehydrorhamnose reductase
VPQAKLNVLVIGADGMIGRALASELRQRGHGVIGTTRRTEQKDDNTIFLDLTAAELPMLPPADVAVICAAMARFADCRDQSELTHHVNVKARLELADLMRARGQRIIALSSSAVFDNMRPHAKADWEPAPRSAYGRQMAEAEAGVLARGGTVLRSSKVLTDRTGIFLDWIRTFRGGGQVHAFDDHTICPLPLNSMIEAIIALIERPSDGIFQISGASDISYADAARLLANQAGVSEERVVPVRAVDRGIPKSEVMPFTSLDTSRLTELMGFRPPEPATVIDAAFRQLLSECES